MKKIKVLHLASFIGNIGDNANHSGARYALNKYKHKFNFDFVNEEIREYYWNNKKFDENFIKKCNKHDLIIIGGGNYFEFYIKHSRTGTSIDIPPSMLKKIFPPIIFFSLGADSGQGYTRKTLSKCKGFFEYLISEPNKYYLSVRNDGSKGTIKDFFGIDIQKNFKKIPDGAFLIQINDKYPLNLEKDKKYIGVNLAGDMPEIRYDNGWEKTLEKVCFALTEIVTKKNRDIIFFPHIFKDLEIINDLIKKFNDKIRRENIIVAPLISKDNGMSQIFNMYSKCEVIMGNRFHSNVCSIALNIPTIALHNNYPQIEMLYEEMNLKERLVDLSSDLLDQKILDIYSETIDEYQNVKKQYLNVLEIIKKEHKKEMDNLINWISTRI